MNYSKLTFLNFFYSVILLLMIISCPNDQMRDLVELKVSDPVADIFIINSGAPTSSRTVILNSDVTKEEDALEMRFKNAGYSWSDWEAYLSSKTWTLPIGDGTKTVYAEYRDEGHHVVSMTNNIDLDTGAPAGPGIYVWGSGTETGQIHDYINSRSCTLFMNVVGANRMRFSNTLDTEDPDDWNTETPTLSYADSYSWTLSAGDGDKTVYSQFLDAADNDSYFNYTIRLDETAPSVSSFQINNNDATANEIGSTLTYNYTETNAVWAEYRNDGGSWSARESISGGSVTKSWGLRSETGTRTVYVRLKDIAGNVSSTYSDDIYLSTAAPGIPVPTTATPTNNTTPTWTWSAVTGAVNYRCYFPDFPMEELGNVTSFTPSSPLYTNQDHTFHLQAADIAGNWSAAGTHTVTIDTDPPSVPVSASGQTSSPTNDRTPTWTWAGGGGGNGTFRYKLDDSNLSSGASLTSSTSYTPSSDLSQGTHTIYVQERDAAGNWSDTYSSSIQIIYAYSLTVTNGGNGSTSPSGTFSVNHGTATSIIATPASADYSFVNWTVTSGTAAIASPTSASTTVTLTGGDATVQANFIHYLDVGLKVYYRFSGNADDSSGNNIHGTVIGGTTLTTDRNSNANSAYHFNGIDGYISNPTADFTTTSNVTVSFWVNADVITESLEYFINCNDFGIGQSGSSLSLAISTPSTSSSSAAITAGTWYHFTGTYDGTDIRVYLNGSFVSLRNHPGTISNTGRNLELGRWDFSISPGYWAGKIDSFRIYNRTLSAAEIIDLYNLAD